jgi:glutaredoxin 3
MPKVVMYTIDWCGYCDAARRLLSSKNVPFEEINLTGKSAEREDLVEMAGGRTTVPQIFIGDTHVGGCDELYALERAGRLDPMLAD